MPRRSHLPCSLPLLALSLLAVAGPVRGEDTVPFGADASTRLIDVKDASSPSIPLLHEATDEQTWTMVWSDPGMTDGAALPTSAAGGVEQFVRANARPPQAPPVIAAPLPPALLSGLIGLGGVYFYKRRHRLG